MLYIYVFNIREVVVGFYFLFKLLIVNFYNMVKKKRRDKKEELPYTSNLKFLSYSLCQTRFIN